MVDDKRDLGAFVPAALDDYPLTPTEFRVYCRIVRRAGAGECWESDVAMMSALGMSRRTVRRTKAFLVACGLVARTDEPGKAPRYALTPASQWASPEKVAEVRAAENPPQSGVATRAPRGHQGTPTAATRAPGGRSPEHPEGTTKKEVPKGDPRKSRLPEGWEPNLKHRSQARDAGLDFSHEHQQFVDHHTAKGSRYTDWDAAFRTWLRNAGKWKRERGGTGTGYAPVVRYVD
jgi:hypothetical protein